MVRRWTQRLRGTPAHAGDRIHIERRPRIGCGLVGNEQARYSPTHEYEFTKQRAQETSSGDQLLKIWFVHWLPAAGGTALFRQFFVHGRGCPATHRRGQVRVKGWVAQGRDGGGLVQRLERDAPLLALLVRPDGNWLVPLRNNLAQRLGGVRRGDPAGKRSAFRRKNVLKPAEEEFFERGKVRAVLQSRAVKQVAGLSAPHGGMHLRRAHHQLRSKLGVRRTIRPGCNNLERYVNVLGL